MAYCLFFPLLARGWWPANILSESDARNPPYQILKKFNIFPPTLSFQMRQSKCNNEKQNNTQIAKNLKKKAGNGRMGFWQKNNNKKTTKKYQKRWPIHFFEARHSDEPEAPLLVFFRRPEFANFYGPPPNNRGRELKIERLGKFE